MNLTEVECVASWQCQDENDRQSPFDCVGTERRSERPGRYPELGPWKNALSPTFSDETTCAEEDRYEVTERTERNEQVEGSHGSTTPKYVLEEQGSGDLVRICNLFLWY